MMRFTKTHRAHRLVPCAASVLTLSLIATLKIEHSCSQEPRPQPQTSPSLIYPYPEILSMMACFPSATLPTSRCSNPHRKKARIAVYNSILWASNNYNPRILPGAD